MVSSNRKVIWAIDAFEPKNEILQHAVAALRNLTEQNPTLSVEPVYVMGPGQLNLSAEFTTPVLTHYRPPAEQALRQLCQEMAVTHVLDPKVLLQTQSSTSQAVQTLTDYAERTHAEMIVVGSHGRHGLRRVLMGSFAEALLVMSKVPVMVAGAFCEKRRNASHWLFPTDFSGNAELLFRRVIDLAVEVQARLTLFHAVPSPIEPVFQSGVYLLGGAWLPVHAYFSKEVEKHQSRAEKWARWAKRQGVPVEVVVETRAINIADSIVDLAGRDKVGMILMDSQSGRVKSALIGSITRQVLRAAPCPVWVMKSDLLKRTEVRRHLPFAA